VYLVKKIEQISLVKEMCVTNLNQLVVLFYRWGFTHSAPRQSSSVSKR